MPTETNNRTRLKILFLLFVISLLAIIISVLLSQTEQQLPAVLSGAVGSSLLGGSLSMLVAETIGTQLSDIESHVTPNSRVESDTSDLGELEGTWYRYRMTVIEGIPIWRAYEIWLSANGTSTSLGATVLTQTKNDRLRPYEFRLAVRGDTLIGISEASGSTSEPPAIDIVPHFSKSHLDTFLGVQLFEDWDGNRQVAWVLWSRNCLVKNQAEPDSDDVENLDRTIANLETRLLGNLLSSSLS